MKFSFLHIADIHLSRSFSQFSNFSYNKELSEVYKNALEACLDNIFKVAILKQVDFVLIAGDTFNSSEHDFSSKFLLKKFLDRFDEEGIKVFLICGNHDYLSSYNKNTFNYDNNSNIKIIGLNTEFYGTFPVYNKNNEYICKVHALSFRDEIFNENPVKYFTKVYDNDFHIGLLHCDLNADKSSRYAPCSITELKELNYDYFALGHIHLPSSDNSNILYSGTIQGRNIKETGEHGIRYIEVNSKTVVKNEFIPTDVLRFENLSIDITESKDTVSAAELITDKIRLFISNFDKVKYLLRINLTGQIEFLSDINEEFYNQLAERTLREFMHRVYILDFSSELKSYTSENVLKSDDGISGELYEISSDDELVSNLYDEIYLSVKNAADKCNFTSEELNELKSKVIKSAKEECKSICIGLYNSLEEADE